MKPLHSFTRGGQLAVHQYHMLKQICFVTIVLSILTGLLVGGILFFAETTSAQRYIYETYLLADFKVSISLKNPAAAHQEFKSASGKVLVVKSNEILRNPWILRQVKNFEKILSRVLSKSLWSMMFAAFLIIGYFLVRGMITDQKKLERGGCIVSPKTLKRLIKKSKQASDLTLDGLPLLKDKETSHILITGTTGSGKTNCLHTLLPQIRKRPNRAVIVDLTGDFVSKYYREGQDLLLNPFDQRSQLWSPWGECLMESHYDTLAASIVPKTSFTEPFWENAGKALLSSALKELARRGEKDTQKLYEILVRSDLTDFSNFFRHTDAATYTHTDGEKMTLSIRATLANHLQSFRLLKNVETGFSIRKWVTDESNSDSDQWLFLSARADQRETLRPLISGWLDSALNALMSLPPELSSSSRRLWFIIDELPALQRLPSLETALAEGRKYGGCMLAGVQSIPQLSTTYGTTQSQALLDLFNTKIFFRNTDPNTTAWISKVLGEAETTEHIENLSYGAHTMRDGVNLAQHTRTKPLVLSTEIGALEDCEAYLKLPSSFPVTKIKMGIKICPTIATTFSLSYD
ncbi:MAG TPA: type IV secretion system DNA-binding domain-containing protein [Alphaproteobacteria bacterium]|nr:type IV secretion system DNA-binding domain-containing protein [Alphaproteobacteria bacterium]